MTRANPKQYRPQPGSVAWRVIEFFTTNPEEKLTSGDISAKFDVPSKQVHSLLAAAVECGALARFSDEDEEHDELVYRMGDGLPQITPNRGAHPTLKGAGIANAIASPASMLARAGRRSTAELIDLDILSAPVEAGIPIPPKGRPSVSRQLREKLTTLKPGDSVRFPVAVAKSAGPVLNELKKEGLGEFTLRNVEEGFIRVWREK